MNKKNIDNDNELVWVKLFFKWLSVFTLTLIEDIWARRFIAIGISGLGIGCAVVFINKVINLLNLLK